MVAWFGWCGMGMGMGDNKKLHILWIMFSCELARPLMNPSSFSMLGIDICAPFFSSISIACGNGIVINFQPEIKTQKGLKETLLIEINYDFAVLYTVTRCVRLLIVA